MAARTLPTPSFDGFDLVSEGGETTDTRPDTAIENPAPNVWVIDPKKHTAHRLDVMSIAEVLGDTDDGDGDKEPGESWEPVDMAAARLKSSTMPALGARDDGKHVVYPGKVHWVYGPSESGKTWLCLFFAAQVLDGQGSVLYVDFEDSAKDIRERLLLLGVSAAVVDDPARFAYIKPEEPLGHADSKRKFKATLDRRFNLAVVDGVTEAMMLEELNDYRGADIAKWQNLLPRPVAGKTGAAVLCIDHVTKDPSGHGEPIGGAHKKSGVDGAAFTVVRKESFRRGGKGHSHIRVGKDRPGYVREIGTDYESKTNTHLIGEFTLDDSVTPSVVKFSVPDPDTHTDDWKPTYWMERLSKYLEGLQGDSDDPDRAKTKIRDHALKTFETSKGKPKKAHLEKAIECLLDEGWWTCEVGPRGAKLCTVVTPYRENDPADVAGLHTLPAEGATPDGSD